jgi:acetyltransferase EpsM
MKNIIIFGGKGNGTVVFAVIQDINRIKPTYNVLGFVNNQFNKIKEIDGIPVLGDIGDLPKLIHEENSVFINAITSINTMEKVKDLYENKYPELIGFSESIIHPSNFLGYNLKIGKGVFLGPQCYLGQNLIIEDFCFIHSHCYIARDSTIKQFGYLSPKVYIGAEVVVEKYAYIGTGSLIKERLHIGEQSIIGMGSNVIDHVPPYSVFYGPKAQRKEK